MRNNAIQFAIVREDPETEVKILSQITDPREALLIGSGGCTAFTLRNKFPELQISLIEPNPAQIDLIRKKEKTLKEDPNYRNYSFGIGVESSTALNFCGNFESLFRSFKNFLYEFVLDQEGWNAFFTQPEKQGELYKYITSSKYWPVAFELFFSDSILIAMFGADAVQHAPRGSYPKYFQKVLEKGLKSKAAHKNYFLHHIFLGKYLNQPDCLPTYLTEKLQGKQFAINQVLAQEAPSFSKFDMISFSNIFDWMDKKQVAHIAKRVARELKSGSFIVYRQLNNKTNFRSLFGVKVKFNDSLSKKLYANDRSLFYSSIHIGRKEK